MERKLNILKPFFEEPNREFHIRERSRILKINHTSIRQYLNKLTKEDFLEFLKGKVYSSYKAKINKKFLNLKLYDNLEKLRISEIVEDLEKKFDYPAIIVFGSYASAYDDKNSDVDICLITNIKKEFNTEKYERILNRKVSPHFFSDKEWERNKIKNRQLVNNICNGIVLSGQLEVIK